MKKFLFFLALVFLIFSCTNEEKGYDATGVFEAQEIIVSSEVAGKVLSFDLTEGQQFDANTNVGAIECSDLVLQKAQIQAQIDALSLKRGDAGPETSVIIKQIAAQEAQIATLNTQLAVVEVEKRRIKSLVDSESAPRKQLDDVNGQIDILNKNIAAANSQIQVLNQRIKAQNSTVSIKNRGLMSAEKPLQANIIRLENQLSKCAIINPAKGTVLTKYIEIYEMVSPGKALYKIANLEEMTLRAYLTGDQMNQVQLGKTVRVNIDAGENSSKSFDGKITWISDKAEFTPKTIQTKNERANLVYAIKIAVPNDGTIRIGMYGEIIL